MSSLLFSKQPARLSAELYSEENQEVDEKNSVALLSCL